MRRNFHNILTIADMYQFCQVCRVDLQRGLLLKLFQNKMFRIIFGPEKGGVSKQFGKSYNGNLL